MTTASKTCPCPECQNPGLWLSDLSRNAYVDYYRCFTCAHVWTVPKEQCEPVHDVTLKIQ